MNQRPTGVTILAILAFVGGILSILFGGLGALLGGFFASLSPVVGGFATIWGILYIILGVALVYVGWGFWRLVPSAWRLGIWVATASILLAILRAVTGGGLDIIGIVIDVAIIYYLTTPAVRAAFGQSTSGGMMDAVMGAFGMGGGGTAAAASAPPPAPPVEPPAMSPPASGSWGSSTGSSTGGETSSGGEAAERDEDAKL
jgi:hypothetical protein